MTPQLPAPKTTLGAGTYQAKQYHRRDRRTPARPPGLEPDGRLVWTYFEALKPERFPRSLLVVGAGAIGVEFASFDPDLRRRGDARRSAAANPAGRRRRDRRPGAQEFREAGHRHPDGDKGRGSEKKADSVVATPERRGRRDRTLEVERVLSAAGVVANVEILGLEALGVALSAGAITTDGFGRTNVAGSFAIGDVAGGPMLAHKAEHEASPAWRRSRPADACARQSARPRLHLLPSAGGLGRSDGGEGQGGGPRLRVGRFPYLANGKAVALGEPEGWSKRFSIREPAGCSGRISSAPKRLNSSRVSSSR